jgi:hypothetical protein
MRANKNMQNMPPKFYCEKCDYGCCKKSIWEQHLLTAKHSKANFGLMQANKEYACEKCTIKFKHQSSYCRHKKKCQEITVEIDKNEVTDKELIMMLLHLFTFQTPIVNQLIKNMLNINRVQTLR